MEKTEKEENLLEYVPFLAELIRKLQTTNSDNSREPQLSKIVILHDMIKNKKLKPDSLSKCKGVIMKLQEKVPVASSPVLATPESQLLTVEQNDRISTKKQVFSTPDSPTGSPNSNRKSMPFIIPTERTEPLPGTSYSYRDDFTRRNTGFEKQTTSSADLFRRRSPNRYKIEPNHSGIIANDFTPPFKNEIFNVKNVKTEKPERNYLRQSVFQRLGNKVEKSTEDRVEKPTFENFKIVKQVTNSTIDVLKSPPLSEDDIYSLLCENSNKKELERNDLNQLNALRNQIVTAIEENDSVKPFDLNSTKKLEEPKSFGVGQSRLAYKYGPHPRKKVVDDDQCESLDLDSTFSPKFLCSNDANQKNRISHNIFPMQMNSDCTNPTPLQKFDTCFETIPVPKDPRLRKNSIDCSKNRDYVPTPRQVSSPSSNLSALNFPTVNCNDPRLNRNKNEAINLNSHNRSKSPNYDSSRDDFQSRSKSPSIGPRNDFRSRSKSPRNHFRNRSKSPNVGLRNDFQNRSKSPCNGLRNDFQSRSKSPGIDPGHHFRNRSKSPSGPSNFCRNNTIDGDLESYSRFRPNLNDQLERKKYEKSKKANRDDEEVIIPKDLEQVLNKKTNSKLQKKDEHCKLNNYSNNHSISNRHDYSTNKSSYAERFSMTNTNFKIPKIKKEGNVENEISKNRDNNSTQFNERKQCARPNYRNRKNDFRNNRHSRPINTNLRQIYVCKEQRQEERNNDKTKRVSNANINITISDSDSISNVSNDSEVPIKIESNEDSDQISLVQSISSDESIILESVSSKEEEEPKKDAQVDLSNKPKEISRDWLEGLFQNLCNPEFLGKDNLLQMLSKVMDSNKFNEIKQIVERPDVPEASSSKETDKEIMPTEVISTDEKQNKITTEPGTVNKEKKKTKRMNELEKLNEDICNMFIREGVLTSTGKRMCTMLDENKRNQKLVTTPSSVTEVSSNENYDETCEEDDEDDDDDNDSVTSTGLQVRRKKPRQTSLQAKKVISKQLASKYKKNLKTIKDPKQRVLRSSKSELVLPLDLDGTPKKNQVKVLIEKLNVDKIKKTETQEAENNKDTEIEITKIIKPKKKRKSQWSTGNIQKKKKKIVIPKETLKNNNPDIHLCNKIISDCSYCDYKGSWIVNHYALKHPKLEVMVSRLSPDISKEIKENQMCRTGKKIYDKKHIQIVFDCFFCNKERSLTAKSWSEHITMHTGEYSYKCSTCSYRNACLQPTTNHTKKCNGVPLKVLNTQFEDNHFYGYLCNICNYVQISKKNLENHIKNQHTEKTVIIKFSLVNFDNKTELRTRKKIDKKRTSSDTIITVCTNETAETNETIESDATNENADAIVPNDKSLNAFIAPKEEENDDLSDIINLPVPERKKPLSIADKLNKRFNIVDQLDVEKNKNKDSQSEISQESDSDVLLITLNTNCNSTNLSMNEKALKKNTDNLSQPSTSKALNEINDTDEIDDNEWEDIESSDIENGIDDKGTIPTGELIKKSNICLTLNRLYESMSKTSLQKNYISKEINEEDNQKNDKRKSLEDLNANKKKKPRVDYRELLRIQEKELQILNCEKLQPALPIEIVNVPTITPPLKIKNEQIEADSNNFYGFSVKNIGYHKLNSTIFFICFYGDCTLKTKDQNLFISHIKSHTESWEGFCNICVSTVSSNETLTLFDEYQHMLKAHLCLNDRIDMENPESEIKNAEETSKPLIKFKMLPGDMLSTIKASTPINMSEISNNCSVSQPILLHDFSPSSSSTFDSLPSRINDKCVPVNTTNNSFSDPTPIPSQTNSILPLLVPVKTSSTNNESTPIMNSGFKITNVISLRNDTESPTNIDGPNPINASRAPDKSIHPLKPWTKTTYFKGPIYEKMINDVCLLSTFKCMGLNCIYTTSNSEKFLEHLNNHEKYAEHRLSLNVPDLDTMSWLECSYCDIVAGSRNSLTKHIIDEHKTSIFQCNSCFYRSVTPHNLIVHNNLVHKIGKYVKLVCNGDMKKLNIEHLLESRNKNIRSLTCGDENCTNKEFFVPKRFVEHIEQHPGTFFRCQFCDLKIRKESAIRHMLCHGIGIFNCIYCVFGTNTMICMRNHMCNLHPSELLFISVRIVLKELSNVKNLDSSDINSILLAHIGYSDPILFKYSYLTDEELDCFDPVISNENSSNIQIRDQQDIRLNVDPTRVLSASDINYTDVIDDIRVHKKFLIDFPNFYNNYENDINLQISTFAKTASSVTSPKISQTIVVNNAEPIPLNPNRINANQTIHEPSLDGMEEVYANINEILKKSGLNGEDLYKCNICDLKYKEHRGFIAHLYSHPAAEHKCYHCDFSHKTVSLLGTHIQTHSTKTHFCYSCAYTSSSLQKVLEHYNKKHTTENIKSNLQTIKIGPTNVVVICPKKTSESDMHKFAKTLSEKYKEEKLRLKKYYSPQEIGDLPRQAILGHEISCTVCSYVTKVRTNMHRHLLLHLNEVTVSANDPVNPVPCLNNTEKHFDKMANLACSSQEIGRSKTFPDAPKFVAAQQRFECGAIGCKYQTIDADMLRNHLFTLHSNEQNYKCPHCSHEVNTGLLPSEIISHLKFHDATLFKCSKCEIYHYSQQYMKHHVSESHNMIGMVLKVRDENSQQQLPPQPSPSPAKTDIDTINKWICEICKTRTTTRSLIMHHTWLHHGTKSQYQCGVCGLLSTVKSSFKEHFNNKHPKDNLFIKTTYSRIDEDDLEMQKLDTTPIWTRDNSRVKSIRGILFEDEDNCLLSGSGSDDNENGDDDYNPLQIVKPAKNEEKKQKDIDNSSIQSNQLDGIISFVCLHCIKRCPSIDELKFHWEISHKMPKTISSKFYPGRPFLFKIIKSYRCMYCKKILSYPDMVNHIQRNHQKKKFATLNPTNLKECGECIFKINNSQYFLDHYEMAHTTTKTDSMEFLTKEFLNELLKLNSGSKYYCELCNYFGDTIQEISVHSKDTHKDSEIKYKQKDNGILYFCPHCKSSNSDDFKIVQHIIKTHGTLYKCNYCESLFKYTKLVAEHNLDVHHKKDKGYGTIGLETILQRCELMKIVFSNGLVINKIDAKKTKYGSFDEIREKLKQLKETNYIGLVPSIGKRRLSNDDNNICQQKKKRKLINSIDKNIAPVSSETIVNDNIKQEIVSEGYSFYGKRSKPLNLENIYTNMNFCGSYVQISCDRFAELCDINPKLIVAKLDTSDLNEMIDESKMLSEEGVVVKNEN